MRSFHAQPVAGGVLRTAGCAGLLAFAGCKAAPTAAPIPVIHDLGGAQRALDHNARSLEAAGVYVPAAPEKVAPVAPDERTPAQVPADAGPEPGAAPGEQEADEEAPADAPAAEAFPELESARSAREEEGRDRRYERRSRRQKASANRRRCEQLCQLAGASCDLEGKVCSLAERHPDDPRYADACERAISHCDAAEAACAECSR